MKKLLLPILFCILSISVHAQFTDDFTDGNFSANPVWTGDNAFWQITNGQLNSNGPIVTGTVLQLVTPSTLASDAQWEFFVNPKFGTSSSNYIDVFLTSDSANLKGQNKGYFVRIGGTDDEVSLFLKQGGVTNKIIDGTNGQIASSSNNPTKVKVVRTLSNQWTLYADFGGLGTNYIYQGTTVNAAVTTSAYFGVLVKYSSSNFNKHFFDDFVVGNIVADNTPPTINKVLVTSQNQLDVLFSEPVDLISAQTPSNYTVNQSIGSASTAVRDVVNQSLVHLTFSNNFIDGNYYDLTVNNVQDLNTNTIVANSIYPFPFYIAKPALFKDIIINEIFADPTCTSPVNLPSVEFIEVYNRSTNAIDLKDWKLNGGPAFSSYVILPSEYLILCASGNASSFAPFGKVHEISMPSLANGGAPLNLTDNNGTTIDSVRYSDSWYRDDIKKDGCWTLELINPSFSANCPPDFNWIASNAADGGTPGTQNSVYNNAPDNVGPVVTSIVATDNLHVSLCFDESIDVGALINANNYSIDNGIGIPLSAAVNTGTSNRCVTLTLSAPLTNKSNYILSLSGISDCSGNSASNLNPKFSYYIAQPYDILINELMPDEAPSVGLPLNEYVELHNRTPYKINMNKWFFKVGTNSKPLPDISIEADSFVVLTSDAGLINYNKVYGKSLPVYAVTNFQALTNSGATLVLSKDNHSVIHTISYNIDWYGDVSKETGGYSMELIDRNNPCGGAENWHASYNINGGTPGFRNSARGSKPDAVLPELEKIVLIDASRIRVYFTESVDTSSMMNLSNYSVDNGVSILSIDPVQSDYKSAYMTLSSPISKGVIYTLTMNSVIKDCAGNTMSASSGRFSLPETIEPLDIAINEILFNPKTNGVDFLELYNRSMEVLNLKDLYVSSIDTNTLNLTSVYQIDSVGYLLFPGEYVVLTTKPDTVKSQYETINPKGFIKMASMPSFSTSDGRAVISLKDGTIIDKFYYTEKMHFPLLNDKKGVSLERINPNRPTQDPTNWHSASQQVGFATPAYKNSQYSDSENDGSEFKLDPEIFSPDNDGNKDVLNIHYKFDEPDYTVSVDIYDAVGRLVRRLVKNELAGTEGTFSWDGVTEKLNKARIGIYVILIEAYNSKGDTKNKKLTCVVAGDLNN